MSPRLRRFIETVLVITGAIVIFFVASFALDAVTGGSIRKRIEHELSTSTPAPTIIPTASPTTSPTLTPAPVIMSESTPLPEECLESYVIPDAGILANFYLAEIGMTNVPEWSFYYMHEGKLLLTMAFSGDRVVSVEFVCAGLDEEQLSYYPIWGEISIYDPGAEENFGD